jgi:hypothetical protein
MSDQKVEFESIPAETHEAMQTAADNLVDLMKLLLPPQGERTPDEYDAISQHTIVGNAMIRILIAISEKIGPLDLGAIRNGAFQGIAYVSSVAQPITNPNPGQAPKIN